MREAVDDIMVTLNEAASEVGMVGGMVESIAEAMAKVSAAGKHWWLLYFHFPGNHECDRSYHFMDTGSCKGHECSYRQSSS